MAGRRSDGGLMAGLDKKERKYTEEQFQARQKEIVALCVAARGPSLAERLSRSPNREEILSRLTPIQFMRLRHDWRFWGRPKQLIPLEVGDWRDCLIVAGRGFGKTRTGVEAVVDRICRGLAKSVCVIGPTHRDTRDILIGGIPGSDSGLMDLFPPWYPRDSREGIEYNSHKGLIHIWPHDCTIYIRTGEDKEQRGGNYDLVLLDEPVKFRHIGTVLYNLDMALRKKTGRTQRIITTSPMRQEWLMDMMMADRTLVIHGTSGENESNVDPFFVQTMKERYAGTRLGDQELEALILGDNARALASTTAIDKARILDVGASKLDLDEYAVGVDPAVSTKRLSDDSGIVVCGRKGKELYVLEDATGRYTPDGWSEKAVQLAKDYGAKLIVFERNKIGDAGVALLKHAIAKLGAKVDVKECYSFKDKWTRAQSVSPLYERGHAHHVGHFRDLEMQLTQWDPSASRFSPNSLDSFVHAAVELMGLAITEDKRDPHAAFQGLRDANKRFLVDRSGIL
jgi:predicted phage terminase large subunit-like protein